MNPHLFKEIESVLHTERIDAYRQDGADEQTALARYLLNVALSEALYPVLQFSEVALRNAIHSQLTARCGTDAWYDSTQSRLTPWQEGKVTEAKKILGSRKRSHTSGRIVAELSFAFWTGFFNNAHARTGIGTFLAKQAFPFAPRTEQARNKLSRRWRGIRDLRNRVFHHERILHWQDLAQRHQDILEVTEWMSPELKNVASSLDRFATIRKDGLKPWNDQIQKQWPNNS